MAELSLRALCGIEKYEIFEDISNSNKRGFQCEKAVGLWHRPDTTAQDRKKQSQWNEWQILRI
jgi:hypothetical protein